MCSSLPGRDKKNKAAELCEFTVLSHLVQLDE